MAKTYAQLVAEGSIKSYNSRTSVNQFAQNEIASDNKKGESVLAEIQNLSENHAVNFTHDASSFSSTRIQNPALALSYSSQVPIKLSATMLQTEEMKNAAKTYFETTLVVEAAQEEKNTISYFTQLNPLLNNHEKVLHFLNGKENKNFDQELNNLIKKTQTNTISPEVLSELIYNTLTGKAKVNEKQTIGSSVTSLEDVLRALDYGDAKQFVITAMALLEHTGTDKDAAKGATTLIELLAINDMSMKYKILTGEVTTVDGKPIAESTGSMFSNDKKLEPYIDKIKEAATKQLTFDAAKELFDNNFQNFTTNQKLQKGISTSGSTESNLSGIHVADLIFRIPGRDIYIDAKFGKNPTKGRYNIGGRYTPSGGITTSIEEINKSVVLQSLFEEKLNIITNFLFYELVINGDKVEKTFKNRELLSFITYALLGSEAFVSHYRNLETGRQSDFLFTLSGLVWYSQFFAVVVKVLFESSNPTKVSLRFRHNFNEQTIKNYKETLAANPSKNNKTLDSIIELMDDIKISKDLKEEFQRFATLFKNSKTVNFKLDVSDVTGKIEKAVNNIAQDSKQRGLW